jgi:hypothetical protein
MMVLKVLEQQVKLLELLLIGQHKVALVLLGIKSLPINMELPWAKSSMRKVLMSSLDQVLMSKEFHIMVEPLNTSVVKIQL